MIPPYYFITDKGKTKVFFKVEDYHGKEGMIRKEFIKKAKSGEILKTHLDKKLIVYSAFYKDIIESFVRGPQTIILKDASYIILNSIDKTKSVLEAGTGSGSMTAFFSLYSKKVVSFEERKEFYELSKKNLELYNYKGEFDNFVLINDNIRNVKNYTGEKFDVIFLDLPNPKEILSYLEKNMKEDTLIICYLPNVSQMIETTNYLREKDYYIQETLELIKRNWVFKGRISKPEKDLLHTAFLLFSKKTFKTFTK